MSDRGDAEDVEDLDDQRPAQRYSTSDASKLFTVGYLAVGVSLLAATFNEILKRRQRHRRERRARRR